MGVRALMVVVVMVIVEIQIGIKVGRLTMRWED